MENAAFNPYLNDNIRINKSKPILKWLLELFNYRTIVLDKKQLGKILAAGSERQQQTRATRVKRLFWSTLKKAAQYIPFTRELIAAYYCAFDPATPKHVKATLFAALAYFVMPIDIIPDFLAIIGFSDDITVLAAALATIKPYINEQHFDLADEALEAKNVKKSAY